MRMMLAALVLGLIAADAPLARTVLEQHCHRCHGQDGSLEGGMNYILDAEKLIARGKIVPGEPETSPLWRRISKGQMPPADVEQRLTPAELQAVRDWIISGAKASDSRQAVTVVSPAAVNAALLADLDKADRRTRRFYRYFSLVHLHNAGLGADELQTYRAALTKLLNSLSWHPRIATPVPVDAAGLLLRLDLRDLLWDAPLWNRLLDEYPYGVLDGRSTSRTIMAATATRMPIVRADWFLATASRAPLYYDLLLLPGNLTELERQLRVDAVGDIRQERVARAGFNGSGVSRNNRLLERHVSAHGVYWRTYDFEAVPQNLAERGLLAPDPRNLFAFPLGPVGVSSAAEPFRHAGGEAIFSLPNGLHGYMLVNAIGDRVNKAPVEIVSDPRRPDRAVEAGVSCMSCHVTGILPKGDQVRPFAAANPQAFPRATAELVRALYPPAEAMTRLMDDDAARYHDALRRCGIRPGRTEPVSTLTLRYETDLDLTTAAAEAGVNPETLTRQLAASDASTRNLGALRSTGGTVSRAVFVQSFGDLVRDLALGDLFRPNGGEQLPDATGDADPLEGPASEVNAAVLLPDGRSAVFAGADRAGRLWDVEAGRERKELIGHTASVWAVALSPDATRIATGSADGTVRLWDANTGTETLRLDAHLGLVAAVAFSPDGRRLVSAGHDHAVVLWDLASGQELRRWEGTARFPSAAIFSADGGQVIVAAGRSLWSWDTEAKSPARRYDGPGAIITSLTRVPGQGQWLTGSDDGPAHLWDAGTGKPLRTLTGHSGPVTAVAASPNGRWLATGSADRTVILWNRETGERLGTFRKHPSALVGLTFSTDSQQTLSVGRTTEVLSWSLAKVGSATATPPPAEVAPSAPAVKKPTATVPVDGMVGALMPAGDWLHLLDRTSGRLRRFAADSLKVAGELPLATEALAISPDGRRLAAVGSAGQEHRLAVIDLTTWKAGPTTVLSQRPYDVAVDNDGTIYVSASAPDWTDLSVFPPGQELRRWGGVWGRSLLRLAPDGRRLYVIPQGVSPAVVDVWPLAGPESRPTPRTIPLPAGETFQGEPVMSPDGTFLLWPTGTVLRVGTPAGEERSAERLSQWVACAVDTKGQRVVTVGRDGLIRGYNYPAMQPLWTWRVSGSAYRVAVAERRLWLAVFDPARLAARPRALMVTDVQAFELP